MSTANGLTAVADLVEIAGKLPASRVVIAGGDRPDDLRLVEAARDHGIIDRIVLIGREIGINSAVSGVGIDIPSQDILPADDDEQIAAATLELVNSGDIDIVLKGNISTPTINKHMLKLATRSTVSLASLFDAAPIAHGRLMLLTDAGVTTVCNYGRLVGLIQNALEIAHVVMEIPRPRVALLSANEKQVPSLPSTRLGAALSQREWPDAVVYGPLSFDLATDPKSVEIKGIPDLPAAKEVAGNADILVCPGIDAANILYKTIAAMAKYGEASIAGITLGFPVPYGILSRSDTLSTRLESIALCSIYAQRTRAAKQVKAPAHASGVKPYRVLVINPGAASMKMAIYENEECVVQTERPCSVPVDVKPGEEGATLQTLIELITETLQGWDQKKVDALAACGGYLPQPAEKLSGGAYVVAARVNKKIVIQEDILAGVRDCPVEYHACNWGIPLAAELAKKLHCPAFAVDAIDVDEACQESKAPGHSEIACRSAVHNLIIHASVRKAAETIGLPAEQPSLVVVHLGEEIIVAAVRRGNIIGSSIVPLDGDASTPSIREATGNRIAREIGAMYVAVGEDVEAIVFTGGLAQSGPMRSLLRQRVGRLAPILSFPGSPEMAACARGVTEVLRGAIQPLQYHLPGNFDQKGG